MIRPPASLSTVDGWRWVALMLSNTSGAAFGLPVHRYDGACPDALDWSARDPECPACAALIELEEAR